MDVVRYTFEAGFETVWDEKTKTVRYFPRIVLDDGRAKHVLWKGLYYSWEPHSALSSAEDRLTDRLMKLFKDEEE